MRKLILLALFFGSLLFAKDGVFVGLGLGSTAMTHTTTIGSETQNQDGSFGSAEFTVGYLMQEKFRFALNSVMSSGGFQFDFGSYGAITSKEYTLNHNYLSADYIFTEELDLGDFKPYLGAFFGQINSTFDMGSGEKRIGDTTLKYSLEKSEESLMTYGLRLGFDYAINENFDIGLKYQMFFAEFEHTSKNNIGDSDLIFKHSDLSSTMLYLSYLFEL